MSAIPSPSRHRVRPYTRADGTPVRGHLRTNRDTDTPQRASTPGIGIGGLLVLLAILALIGASLNPGG